MCSLHQDRLVWYRSLFLRENGVPNFLRIFNFSHRSQNPPEPCTIQSRNELHSFFTRNSSYSEMNRISLQIDWCVRDCNRFNRFKDLAQQKCQLVWNICQMSAHRDCAVDPVPLIDIGSVPLPTCFLFCKLINDQSSTIPPVSFGKPRILRLAFN